MEAVNLNDPTYEEYTYTSLNQIPGLCGMRQKHTIYIFLLALVTAGGCINLDLLEEMKRDNQRAEEIMKLFSPLLEKKEAA